jgi:hypothetical protein
MAQINENCFTAAVVLTAPMVTSNILHSPNGREAIADLLLRNYDAVRTAHSKIAARTEPDPGVHAI